MTIDCLLEPKICLWHLGQCPKPKAGGYPSASSSTNSDGSDIEEGALDPEWNVTTTPHVPAYPPLTEAELQKVPMQSCTVTVDEHLSQLPGVAPSSPTHVETSFE
jgi:hypothetical protein